MKMHIQLHYTINDIVLNTFIHTYIRENINTYKYNICMHTVSEPTSSIINY